MANDCPICGTPIGGDPQLVRTSETLKPGSCGVNVNGHFCAEVPPAGRARCDAHKGGRPRSYCCRECGLYSAHLAEIRTALSSILTRATPEARASLRSVLWLLGNGIPTTEGRRAGTAYYALTLACGHKKEVKARSRMVEATSVQDPPPKTTHCPDCHNGGNGTTRVPVTEATTLVEPRS